MDEENDQKSNQVDLHVAKKHHPATIYITLGWVFFAISFLLIPLLFGAGAFIMGWLTRKNGKETHGVILMVLSVVGAILGMIIGMIVMSALRVH